MLLWRGAAAVLAASFTRRVWANVALVDCHQDKRWISFRNALEAHQAAGWEPRDHAVEEAASVLLAVHEPAMLPNPDGGLPAGVQGFYEACHRGSSEGFCLYGIINALWVQARADFPDHKRWLDLATFLLGDGMLHCFDFTEDSTWPISSIDIYANKEDLSQFRLPGELSGYQTPGVDPGSIKFKSIGAPARAPIVIWEVGVHASLSAELLNVLHAYADVDLKFRLLLEDQYPAWMPDKCRELYFRFPDCGKVDDDFSSLLRRWIPHSQTDSTPVKIDGLVEEFTHLFMKSKPYVDVFACTVAYLCLLFTRVNAPVLGYFGHPPLFMAPPEDAELFWNSFLELLDRPRTVFAVSDGFLQMQYEYQLGRVLPAVRALAPYTRSTYVPLLRAHVLVLDRPFECVLLCLLRGALQSFDGAVATQLTWEQEAEWAGTRIKDPLPQKHAASVDPQRYPFRFLTRAATDRKFSTFSQFRACVLWPYDMDLVTFYEFYAMHVPLFMPSRLSKYMFQQHHMRYDGIMEGRGPVSLWRSEQSPFNETSVAAVMDIVKFTDYFQFPHVQYFDKFADLFTQLIDIDLHRVSSDMRLFSESRLLTASNFWREALVKVR